MEGQETISIGLAVKTDGKSGVEARASLDEIFTDSAAKEFSVPKFAGDEMFVAFKLEGQREVVEGNLLAIQAKVRALGLTARMSYPKKILNITSKNTPKDHVPAE